jgi:hypothetical protein
MNTPQTGGSGTRINETIRSIAADRDLPISHIWDKAGIPERSYYRKITKRPDLWTVAELASIAAVFGLTYTELAAEAA